MRVYLITGIDRNGHNTNTNSNRYHINGEKYDSKDASYQYTCSISFIDSINCH